jgi:hypothetical protein
VTVLSPLVAIVEMVRRDGVPGDDKAIIALFLELNLEDPGPAPNGVAKPQSTLNADVAGGFDDGATQFDPATGVRSCCWYLQRDRCDDVA